MEFFIDKTVLVQALTRAAQVVKGVAKGSTMTVLRSVKIETSDAGLKFTSSDSIITLLEDVEARVVNAGAILVDADRMLSFAKRVRESVVRVTLAKSRKNALKLSAGRQNLTLSYTSAETYLQVPEPGEGGITLPAGALADLFRTVLPAVSTDDNRYGINGIHLEMTPDRLTAVGTDGSRLHKCTVDVTGALDLPKRQLLGRNTADLVLKQLKDADTIWRVSIALVGRSSVAQFTFAPENGSITLISRCIDGEFPDYRRVIPTEFQRATTIDRADFGSSLDTALAATESSRNHDIRLGFVGDDAIISRKTSETDFQDQVPVQRDSALDCGDFATGVNARFMKEAMTVLGSKTIRLNMGGALDPILVATPGDDSKVLIVMPMRLD